VNLKALNCLHLILISFIPKPTDYLWLPILDASDTYASRSTLSAEPPAPRPTTTVDLTDPLCDARVDSRFCRRRVYVEDFEDDEPEALRLTTETDYSPDTGLYIW